MAKFNHPRSPATASAAAAGAPSPRTNKQNSNNKKGIDSKKSIDHTVFVRFVPSSPNIRRHHLEELFSQIGPIKKSSVIHAPTASAGAAPAAEAEAAGAAVSSYGFVKYTTHDDAVQAAKQLNGRSLKITETEAVQVKVELASAAPAPDNKKNNKSQTNNNNNAPNSKKQQQQAAPSPSTPSNRNQSTTTTSTTTTTATTTHHHLILRNLAFTATEKDIRRVLEQRFGKVLEIHIPTVKAPPTENHGPKEMSRGFGFVTFENIKDAAKCVKVAQANSSSNDNNQGGEDKEEPILIRNRPVRIDFNVSKHMYERKKQEEEELQKLKEDNKMQQQPAKTTKDGKKRHLNEEGEEEDDNSSSEKGSDDDSTSDDTSDDSDDDSESSSDDDDDDKEEENDDEPKEEEEEFTLFVRNLPFDATRQDIFDAMYPFGYINSIYLCRSSDTGLFKGTAFVHYKTKAAAERALQAAATAAAKQSTEASTDAVADAIMVDAESAAAADGGAGGGIMVNGRALRVDWAVDKQTAGVLNSEKQAEKVTGKDRRNLYLKEEGRVEPNETNDDKKRNKKGNNNRQSGWEVLPLKDKEKRERAWNEKLQKLKSPLFFINPTRLSIRNIAKHVTESDLKDLIAKATQRGLVENHLVKPKDQLHHWKAQGELNTREILEKIQQSEQDPIKYPIIPPFHPDNLKKYIPSVFVDRDAEKDVSRGFGFVQFLHHAHALACLRELNNNTYYSELYVHGGAHANHLQKQQQQQKKTSKRGEGGEDEGNVQIPRLIVEFTVENRAKAKRQTIHREQQEANMLKQRKENRLKAKYNIKNTTTAATTANAQKEVTGGDHGAVEDAAAERNEKQEKRIGRGKRQREKKRKLREQQEQEQQQKQSAPLTTESSTRRPTSRARTVSSDGDPMAMMMMEDQRPNNKKKFKKQRVDPAEQKLEQLMEAHTKKRASVVEEPKTDGSSSSGGKKGTVADTAKETGEEKTKSKRWFEG